MAIGNMGEAITPKEIATYWNEGANTRKPYLGEVLFPAKKQLGLDLKWIRGVGGGDIALKPSAFDVETRLRDRIGFEELSTEMPFFKEGTLIKEKDRQALNNVIASGQQGYIDVILGKIFDDVTGLIEGARVQKERMIMQLLSAGGIGITANGVAYEYDYGFNTDHTEDITAVGIGTNWDGTGANPADPFSDIEGWMDIIENDTGERPTRAICTRKTFGYIKDNFPILPLGGGVVTDTLVKEYLKDNYGLTVEIYNKSYVDEGGITRQYFPDGVFTLLPEGTVGNLYYGTTPEESDLLSGGNVNVEIVDLGVAITTENRTDPVNVFTKVSAIMLPSFEGMDKVFIGTVA